MLVLCPDMGILNFKNMKGFLTVDFSRNPAAKNLILILGFNPRHNQRGILLQKKCGKLFNLI